MRIKTEQYRPKGGAYVSEFDQFITDFLHQHPEVEEDRRRGWKIWWDHRIDLDLLDQQRRNAVPVKPYQYE